MRPRNFKEAKLATYTPKALVAVPVAVQRLGVLLPVEEQNSETISETPLDPPATPSPDPSASSAIPVDPKGPSRVQLGRTCKVQRRRLLRRSGGACRSCEYAFQCDIFSICFIKDHEASQKLRSFRHLFFIVSN